MSTLYVTETGVQVHQQGERLLVKRGQEVLQDIPMIKIDRVVLMGKSVSITTPTLYALTRRKVGVYYLSGRGKFVLRTVGEEHHHSRLRQAQTRASDNPAHCMAIAQAIVSGKVRNQRVLVQRHTEGASWGQKALTQMDLMRRQVDSSQNLDELRGREGLAAKEYFHLMRQLLRPPADGQTWGFDRRAYYPPPDPVNALLSFGYTLLLNDMIAACQLSGLDPDIGFFHMVDYNKPAMALDLEEEFRPIIVDSIVMMAINRPVFGLRDFEIGQPWKQRAEDEKYNHTQSKTGEVVKEAAGRPIFMKDTARQKFINLYETRVNEQIYYSPTGEQVSYRRVFELQAYTMARVILGEIERYTAFTVR